MQLGIAANHMLQPCCQRFPLLLQTLSTLAFQLAFETGQLQGFLLVTTLQLFSAGLEAGHILLQQFRARLVNLLLPFADGLLQARFPLPGFRNLCLEALLGGLAFRVFQFAFQLLPFGLRVLLRLGGSEQLLAVFLKVAIRLP